LKQNYFRNPGSNCNKHTLGPPILIWTQEKEKVTCQLNAKADEMFRTLINKYVLSVFSRR
jgi:hypothetical protein